jgi:hypothetical protein
MNPPANDSQAHLRASLYWLFIALSTGLMLGRILAVDSVDKLGQKKERLDKIPGELAAARQDFEKQGLTQDEIHQQLQAKEADLRKRAQVTRPFLSGNDRSRWGTVRALVEDQMRVEGAPYAIDKVIAQPGWDTIDMVKHDGQFYSSKPPLLATLLAGPYWVIHRLTGATLGTHPYELGRCMLILVNVIPLAIAWLLLARLVERFGTTDWGRIFVVAAAALGTFLPTFAVVVNNHLPAAVCATIALYAAVRIWYDGERRLRYFVIAGLFAALLAANELPALSLSAAISLALLWKAPRQTLVAYVPAAVLIAAAFFGTNWIAHHSLRPPYMHRGGGGTDDWYAFDYKGKPSYWQDPKGIDRGEASVGMYAFHALLGHHGVFSLTPVWLLTGIGLVMAMARRDARRLWHLALVIAAVSIVCLCFYLMQPQISRNYGGTTSAFRWVFWLAPLWLLGMIPAADALAGRRWTRGIALALLLISVLSAAYPTWNPWTHPWILDYLQYLGCVQY